MAHIIYGVAGEGSGHSSRAKEVIRHLKTKGHTVTVVSYGRGYRNLHRLYPVHRIFGLRFDYHDNRVHYVGTAIKNALKLPEAVESTGRIVRLIKQEKPCLAFTDFEPITSIAANLTGLPLVSIDNQHRLTDMEVEFPKGYAQEAATAQAVTAMMVNNQAATLITSFFLGKAVTGNTFVFPPILRQEVGRLEPTTGDFILVYLTAPFEALVPMLRHVRQRFVLYGFNRSGQQDNLTFKAPSQDGFLRDLADCRGVIANAGFTLITEALHLHKPYLAMPVKGQFEQILNAYHVEKLGYGKYWDQVDREKIESFLFNLGLYASHVRRYRRTDNSRLFRKIDSSVARYS